MSGTTDPYRYQYEHVAASQTAQVLGGTGAIGDYLHRIVCTVSTAATGTVTVLDGSTSHVVLPNSPGDGIGVYNIMSKAGLYANILAKQERIKAGSGEKMNKVGSKDAPTDKDFKQAAKTAKPENK